MKINENCDPLSPNWESSHAHCAEIYNQKKSGLGGCATYIDDEALLLVYSRSGLLTSEPILNVVQCLKERPLLNEIVMLVNDERLLALAFGNKKSKEYFSEIKNALAALSAVRGGAK